MQNVFMFSFWISNFNIVLIEKDQLLHTLITGEKDTKIPSAESYFKTYTYLSPLSNFEKKIELFIIQCFFLVASGVYSFPHHFAAINKIIAKCGAKFNLECLLLLTSIHTNVNFTVICELKF